MEINGPVFSHESKLVIAEPGIKFKCPDCGRDINKTYDPKSKEHILAGTFPKEADLTKEMEEVAKMLSDLGLPNEMSSGSARWQRMLAEAAGVESPDCQADNLDVFIDSLLPRIQRASVSDDEE